MLQDPDNAHMALDTLIVTTGATVQLSFEWHIQVFLYAVYYYYHFFNIG